MEVRMCRKFRERGQAADDLTGRESIIEIARKTFVSVQEGGKKAGTAKGAWCAVIEEQERGRSG